MPFQNRVFPDMSLHALPARGAWLGNRGGKFHASNQTIGNKTHASKQWIYYVLQFKNRTREVFGKGYTELFFACEASALAAGHRPCFECQRERAKEFQSLFQQVHQLENPPKVALMDAILHRERLSNKPFIFNLETLPNGTIIQNNGFFIKKNNHWQTWEYGGLSDAMPTQGFLLTPKTIVNCFALGFKLS